MNRFVYLIVFLVFVKPGFAQHADSLKVSPNKLQRDMQVLFQQWLHTDNAAGLAFANVSKGGLTTFESHYSSGDHHRVQEGSAVNGLRFYSEGYSRFNERLFARGHFRFSKFVEEDRAWSDVVNTYNANPYIYGSSVRGDYDNQLFDLNVKVYSATLGRFNYGLTLDYQVGDISRQRDPRTRTYMLNYAVVPSVTYSLSGKSRVGVNAYYRYGKERMPNISTVQTDPNLQYYTFIGLHNVQGRVGGYKAFQRQFVSDIIGGALQYNFESTGVKLLLSAGVDMLGQQTLGDKMQSPGSYNSYGFNLTGSLILSNTSFVHNASVVARYNNGGANEFRQTLFTERDTLTGVSTEYWVTDYIYQNRFVVETYNVDFSWKSIALKPNGLERNWTLGAEAAFQAFTNTYYLPLAEYGASRVRAEGNGSFFILDKGEHSIEFTSSVGASYSLNTLLRIDGDTEVSELILRPDLEYHSRNTFEIGGSLTYTFPLRVPRMTAMTGYARLYGENLFANKSYGWLAFGLAIGLLTF